MILNKLQEELKQAQLDKDEVKVSTLRLLLSEVHNSKIQKGTEDLTDSDIQSIIQKEVKKRSESILAFRNGNREEMAQKEEAEAEVLKTYLPEQLSDEELKNLVAEAISQTGATGMSDMGKVIGVVMAGVAGKADGGRVSSLVKEQLNG